MKSSWKLLLVFAVVLAAVAVFFFGIPFSRVIGVYDIAPLKDNLSYGLDLTGGVYVVLEAQETEGEEAITEETLSKAISTIRTRIDALGVKEPTIVTQGENRVRVSIPDVDDAQSALEIIGSTARLEFVAEDGTVVLTGDYIESAKLATQQNDYGVNEPVVILSFNDEGAVLFSKATSTYLGQTISIQLDGEEISAPVVQTQITDGEAVISNINDIEVAQQIATLISAGALPVDFEVIQVQSIGAVLGEYSLQKSLIAGAIGIALVLVFMLVVYRSLGLFADIALLIYLVIYLYVMALLNVTLTLPGIAGIILSVGMAVDANVIIFERIKEEYASGKSWGAAVSGGFKHGVSTIVDSNTTTVIAGLILYLFGSGTIKGFALTLCIGILVSMFTAITVTRFLIKEASNLKPQKAKA